MDAQHRQEHIDHFVDLLNRQENQKLEIRQCSLVHCGARFLAVKGEENIFSRDGILKVCGIHQPS